MDMFLSILFSMLALSAMIIPGFVLRKTKLVGEEAVGALVAVLLYVAQPFLILKHLSYSQDACYDPASRELLVSIGWLTLVSIIGYALIFLLAKLCFFKNRDTDAGRVCIYASIFGNIGFVGIPFVEAVVPGPYSVLFAVISNVIFNMLIWTLGVYIMTGDKKAMRPIKILLNPTVIVLPIALPLFFCKVDLSVSVPPLDMVIKALGGLATPVSMLIVGLRLADMKVKTIFTSAHAYVSGAVKMVAFPVAVFGILMILRALGVFGATDGAFYADYGKPLIMVLTALSALPTAATTLAFAEKCKADYQTAMVTFMNSTLLSVAVVPLVLTLLFLFV